MRTALLGYALNRQRDEAVFAHVDAVLPSVTLSIIHPPLTWFSFRFLSFCGLFPQTGCFCGGKIKIETEHSGVKQRKPAKIKALKNII
jgi:hypothetical protein